MGVTTESSVLKFTLKELDDLVKDVDSQVYLKKDVKYPLKLTPACLQNVNQAISEILSTERLKYIPKYKGLLLAYKHVRRHSNLGTINDDECNILIHIHVDLYIFAPEIGCTMTGIATKVSEDNVACLVHKGFNVTLPRPRNEAGWVGRLVHLGDQVKFKLDTFNVVGTLPFIRGTLLSHVATKREAGAVDFSEDWDLSAVKKHKKQTVARKKKITEESEDAGEEPLLEPVKVKKGKKEAFVEQAVEKKTKSKKRKSDPATESSIDLETKDSNKRKKKLSESSTGEVSKRAPLKGSLLQFLMSEDEDNMEDGLPPAAPVVVKGKKKKAMAPKQDSTTEKSDVSIKALMQDVIKDVDGGTKKSKAKSKNDDFKVMELREDASINANSSKKLKMSMAKTTEVSTGKGKKVAGLTKSLLEQKYGDDSSDLSSENLKSIKKNNLSLPESSSVKAPSLAKKRKLKATAEDVGEVSIEMLMQQALDKVSGKTPAPKKAPKKTPSKKKLEMEALIDAASGKETPNVKPKKSPKKKVTSMESVETPSKSTAVGGNKEVNLLDFLLTDSTPVAAAEPQTSAGKRGKAKALDGTEQTPAKSVAKSKGRSSVANDTDLAAELLAKMQEGLLKSNKKSRKVKQGEEEVPQAATPQPSSTKKATKKHEESIVLPAPEELLSNLKKGSKSPKKKANVKSSADEETTQTPSKVDSESAKKSKSKSKKNMGTNQTFSEDSQGILQTRSIPAENSDSSITKRKSKSMLLDFLDENNSGSERKEMVTDLRQSSLPGSEGILQKTPAKIRKAFVQSPIAAVPNGNAKIKKTPKSKAAQTPLPQVGQDSGESAIQSSGKKSSSVKKAKKSVESKSDLLAELMKMEKSIQFDQEESTPLKLSSKKKSKKQ